MGKFSADMISKLCDHSIFANEGDSTEAGLIANGVIFHELGYDALCAAIIGTSKILLRPNYNATVEQDHFVLWSWCAELLLNPFANVYPLNATEIRSLFEIVLHTALVHCKKPSSAKNSEEHKAEWTEETKNHRVLPHNIKILQQNSHLILSYLIFPLLEATLKKVCAEHVAIDGEIKNSFSVFDEKYTPKGIKGKHRCNNIAHLLELHHIYVAKPNSVILLNKFKNQISLIDPSVDAYLKIYQWRNNSLHGTTNHTTVGWVILNLVLLISLFDLEEVFSAHHTKIFEFTEFVATSGTRFPQSYYPPY